MTIRTVPYDTDHWQLVPKKMAPVMWHAAIAAHDAIGAWVAALATAPEPPAQPEAPTRDLLAEATEQVEALDRENHRMRRCVARLMARLTVWLDDDQFNEADGIMSPEFEPPAQQPTENLPPYSAWLHVLDEAMVVRHLGVADPDDDYITAKRKLHAMFDWEIDVATDPAVGGDRVRKQPMRFDVVYSLLRQQDDQHDGLRDDSWALQIIRAVERYYGINKGESDD